MSDGIIKTSESCQGKVRKNRYDITWFLTALKEKNCPIEYISSFHRYSLGKSVFNCKVHGMFKSIPHLVLKRDGHGCPRCTELARRKPVCGIGENDVLDYDKLDYYLWYNVIRRGHMTGNNYEDVKCHEDWFLFSTFLKDLPLIDNHKMKGLDGWELDKDLFSGRDKIYSKDTTCFLPREINSSLALGDREKNLVGANYDKEIKKYYACVMLDGRRCRFGSFNTKQGAHEKYKEVKSMEISRLAEKHKENLSERTYQALKSWWK